MKLKSILAMALVAVMAFTSCSNDANEIDNQGNEPSAKMGLSFTLPLEATKSFTRTQGATTDEGSVKTVTVYVFNSAGIAATAGGFTQLALADFTKVGDKYTLNTAKNISTDAGNMKVYVAINLPAAKDVAYATETAMKAATANVADLSKAGASDPGFTMFSVVKDASLLEYDPANAAATTTKVTMTIDRVVSKVVSTTNVADYTATWSNGITLKYTIKAFGVYNEAIQTYLPKNATTLSILNNYTNSVAKNNINVPTGAYPKGDVGLTALTGFYVGENFQTFAIKGKTSYAMVATTVEINKAARWDAGAVKYEDIAGGYGSAGVWIVNYEGNTYITNTATKSADIKVGLDALDGTGVKKAFIYKYTDGYVHFRVWLNKEGANDYRVDRNEFIHVRVTGVKALEGAFPGYPGVPTDPQKPIDPNVVDPVNPDPTDPTDPVDPESSMLNVEITVNPWKYKDNSTILQ